MRAAEAQLHAASAEIGVATANLLPQFTITGELGSTRARLRQPVHAGHGHLEHRRRRRAAALRRRHAAAQEARGRGGLRRRRRRNTAAPCSRRSRTSPTRCARCNPTPTRSRRRSAAERAAADSLDLAREQYQLGAISYLTLLDAEQTYQQARISLVQAQATRFADTAALFQALGGGWWNRTDVAANEAGEPERFWLPPIATPSD